MANIVEIGNQLGLRKSIDQEHRMTNLIRSHLAIVDLYPVHYNLQLTKIGKKEPAIAYDFNSAAEDYGKILSAYGLAPCSALRMYLTDDTICSDDFSNQYEYNLIETGVNTLTGASQTVQTLKSLVKGGQSLGDKGTQMGEGIAQGAGTMIAGAVGAGAAALGTDSSIAKAIADLANSAGQTAAEIVLHGKQISLPKIWKSSTYYPSLTLTIKLISPYGVPEAIKNFIIEPLMYVLAMAAPITSDGVTYGLTRPVRVYSYGLSNLNLAYIESVSVRRGGRETAYNIHRQPLIIDVIVGIRPLTEGFGAYMSGGGSDVATMADAATPFTPQLENGPAITTLGNIIQSFRPAPQEVLSNVEMRSGDRAVASGWNADSGSDSSAALEYLYVA